MENASKALIIAGAILLSILIIALGVYIFNMAKSSVNSDTLDSLDISTFNSQFTQYEGDQLGSSVKSLLTAIIASNNTNNDADDRLINVTYYKGDGSLAAGYIEPSVTEESASSSPSAWSGTSSSSPGEVSVSDASKWMSLLSSNLSNTHHYYVTFSYDSSSSGYISDCYIYYTQGNDDS